MLTVYRCLRDPDLTFGSCQILTHTNMNNAKTEEMKETSRTLSDIFYSVIVSLKHV